jgi:bacillithiol system protein YtxJ
MTEPTHNEYDAWTAPDTGRFVPLHSVSAFGELLERSDLETVVVFQHDPYCPISRKAYREIAGAPVRALLVDVTHDEELSRTIEQQTGVRHESPQVLVFRSGEVVWNASHFKITRKAVTRAVQGVSADSFGEADSDCGIACGTRATQKDGASDTANLLAWLRSLWSHQ